MSTADDKIADGARVIVRIDDVGGAIPELGTVKCELPPTDTHPRGGEYDVDLDNGGGVIAWVAELEVIDVGN